MSGNEDMPAKSGRSRSGKARMEKLSSEERRDLAKRAAEKRWDSSKTASPNFLIYQSDDRTTRIDVRLEDETVWLNQGQMAELFQVSKQNISTHVKNVFGERELVESSVVKDYLTTAPDGKGYQTRFYNLDVIISVGYRVKSHRGTQFRIWATKRLKEYVVKGFSLDDERLKNGGARSDYFDELLRRVREIRTSEKNFTRKITDVYATSIDYDPHSQTTEVFFATVQNKFHWAIHRHTAAELIAERANAERPNMGLTCWDGEKIRKSDVSIAKNYLTADELESLNLLVDQYLSFAEFQAKQRKPMHMADWARKLDEFLKLNERDILTTVGRISKQLGKQIAEREFDRFWARQQVIEQNSDVSDFDRYVRKIERERSDPSQR
jgi:hypothetical protein